uniref:Uncharacterized protein n=1 Tax=Oryza sativa subsp. japonica TaxID=39947 RepID=Q5Z8X0_ORYSJ|nr:hypothetical protein [Oryza sativa Japonica Group]
MPPPALGSPSSSQLTSHEACRRQPHQRRSLSSSHWCRSRMVRLRLNCPLTVSASVESAAAFTAHGCDGASLPRREGERGRKKGSKRD